MIHMEFIDPPGLYYAHGRDPFTLEALYDAIERQHAVYGVPDTARIGFLDVSRVDLLALREPELRRFIMRRQARADALSRLPIAVLVTSIADFGKLRMYSILADIGRLRSEDSMFPTQDLGEAAAWLAERHGGADAAGPRRLIEGAAGRAMAEGG